MDRITEKDYKSFVQIYKGLPEREAVKAPKTAFVERIASITKKSTKTVRCWIAGTQTPDALTQDVLEKELNIPAIILFPKEL